MKQKYLETTEKEVLSRIKIIIGNGGIIQHVIIAQDIYMIIYLPK
jgi:hypothetical protein